MKEGEGGTHLNKHLIRFHLCHFSRKHIRLPVPKARSTVLSIHAITPPLVRLNRFSSQNASASPTENLRPPRHHARTDSNISVSRNEETVDHDAFRGGRESVEMVSEGRHDAQDLPECGLGGGAWLPPPRVHDDPVGFPLLVDLLLQLSYFTSVKARVEARWSERSSLRWRQLMG